MSLAECIQTALGVLLLAGGVYWLIALYAVGRFFRPAVRAQDLPAPPVSILKPLKGDDPELLQNIRSFCEQDYPDFELLLGLNRPEEAELEEIQGIAAALSCDKTGLVVSESQIGPNRKVSNLHGMFSEIRKSLIVLSDSDMRVDRDYLRTIVGEYCSAGDIGMVTCLYKISDPKDCGAALESLSIALDFLPSALVAERLEGVSFGFGASMLLSGQTLEEIGGFRSVADYLADDYQLGNRVSKKGLKIVISKYVVENVAGRVGFRAYLKHQLRWARTIRASRPAGYLGSGVGHIMPFGVMLLLLRGADPLSLSVLGLVLLFRYSMAALVYKKVIRTGAWLKWLVLLPVRDCLAFIIWIGAFTGSRVSWRGAVYDVLKGGRIREVS
jgi:ceramide glucosyltransferase